MSINIRVSTGNFRAKAQAAARRASEVVMGELFAAFQASFDKPAWEWPRELPTRDLKGDTLRKKIQSYNRGEGSRAGSPRNIVDEGNLRRTGTYQMTGPFQATFRWSADYATAVHEGAFIYPWGNRNAQRVQLPARPWTRAVLGQENVSSIRTYNLGERLQNVWLAEFRRAR